MKPVLCRSRGMTLVELVAAIVVAGFVFAMAAFLIFVTSRNFVNLRDQLVSQTSASVASERLVSVLRNATRYYIFQGDEDNQLSLRRIRFTEPVGNSVAMRSIEYDTANKVLKYYADGNHASGATPSRVFREIYDFNIVYESSYRLRLEFYFQYQGFALTFTRPRVVQKGQFITDVVAKNHYISQGQTSYEDEYTSTPVRL